MCYQYIPLPPRTIDFNYFEITRVLTRLANELAIPPSIEGKKFGGEGAKAKKFLCLEHIFASNILLIFGAFGLSSPSIITLKHTSGLDSCT